MISRSSFRRAGKSLALPASTLAVAILWGVLETVALNLARWRMARLR